MNTQNTIQAYKPSRYAIAFDALAEVLIMTDYEYHTTAHNFDAYTLSSAVFANDAIEKMMGERLWFTQEQ